MNKENQIESGVGEFDFSQYMEDNPSEAPSEETLEDVLGTSEETEEDDTPEVEEDVQQAPEKETVSEDEVVEQEDEPEQEEEEHVEGDMSWLVRKYIENGVWDDYIVEVDGEEVPLSEIKGLTQEQFLDISNAQKEQLINVNKEKYVNIEDLNEDSLNLLSIVKDGGDITRLLDIKKNLIHPLAGYDLDNEYHQEALVRHMYAVENGIQSQNQLDKLIKSHKEELDLDVVAKGFADRLNNYYKSAVEAEKARLHEARMAEEEKIKNLRIGLRDHFKSMGVKEDAISKPLIDMATKKGERDALYRIDKDFQKMKEDPKELAEFLLWRNNREDYIKMISKEVSKDITLKTLTKLNLARKPDGKKTNTQNNSGKITEFMGSLQELK